MAGGLRLKRFSAIWRLAGFIVGLAMLSEVSAETDSRLNSLLVGAVGLVVGHELGHFAVADLMNVSAEFEGFSIVYPDSIFSSREKLRVASAGFQSQWILSELAFHYLEADDERNRITEKAHLQVKKNHTWEIRITNLLFAIKKISAGQGIV